MCICVCTAIPSCPAKYEGLVQYPTTLAPVTGSKTVTIYCADNAHTISSTMDVQCAHDGSWSDFIPVCECDVGYRKATFNHRLGCVGEVAFYTTSTAFNTFLYVQIALPPVVCEAKSEGLVRYPNWLAPVTGSVAVKTQCGDNAHFTNSSQVVVCTSSGNWTGVIPQCECDNDHHVTTTDDGTEICEGQ